MLNNKIKNILLIKDLSPSRFADEIGVQRSSISHILSGRNKPSLEIVQKIIRRFPDLGMEWILEEEEQEPDEEESNTGKNYKNDTNLKSLTSEELKLADAPPKDSIQASSARQIEKILIFYSDKTFTEYKPG
jgi:transcriptional regulator with XRE-family HTH domain